MFITQSSDCHWSPLHESKANQSMSVGKFDSIERVATIDGKEFKSIIVIPRAGYPFIRAVHLIKMLLGDPSDLATKSARRHFDYIKEKCSDLNVSATIGDNLSVRQYYACCFYHLLFSDEKSKLCGIIMRLLQPYCPLCATIAPCAPRPPPVRHDRPPVRHDRPNQHVFLRRISMTELHSRIRLLRCSILPALKDVPRRATA